MKRLFYNALGILGFVLGSMYLPYPLNAILMLLALLVIALGVILTIRDAYRRTTARFWDALEQREAPKDPTAESDYIPYITTRYRRTK